MLPCTSISFLTISLNWLPPVDCLFIVLSFRKHVAQHFKQINKMNDFSVNGRDRRVISCLSGDLVFHFSPEIMFILSRFRVSKKLSPFFFQDANLLSIFRNTLLFLDIHKVRLSLTRNIELFDVFFIFLFNTLLAAD